MLSLKKILFCHHRFKVAMFFFCFEASLAILSNQVNDRYISSIMNNSRVLFISWEERNFISRNRIACNTSKTKRIRCFFTWLGLVALLRIITVNEKKFDSKNNIFCTQFIRNNSSHWVNSKMYYSLWCIDSFNKGKFFFKQPWQNPSPLPQRYIHKCMQ